MAATKTTTAAARLAELEEAVREARQRRAEIDADRRKASAALSRAEPTRLTLEKNRAAGEDVSDKEIADAVAAIVDAREVADPAVWRARLAGAEQAIGDAELARDEFGRTHFAEIAAEEVPLDAPARDALVDAWETLQEAASAYAIRARRWHHLSRYGGVDAADLPNGTPTAGDMDEVARRFEGGLPVPTPRSLRQ